MGTLDTIKRPITQEMSTFDDRFRAHLSSNVPLVDRVMRYMVKRKGKQLRPILVFLSAKIQGNVTDATYVGASLVEIMHTATLVHDDVVDDADQRRGFFSINALWKNKIAVLIGDYLLSKVLLLAVETKEYTLLEHVSGAVKAMSEGNYCRLRRRENWILRKKCTSKSFSKRRLHCWRPAVWLVLPVLEHPMRRLRNSECWVDT